MIKLLSPVWVYIFVLQCLSVIVCNYFMIVYLSDKPTIIYQFIILVILYFCTRNHFETRCRTLNSFRNDFSLGSSCRGPHFLEA